MDELLVRQMPHSPEAEQAVLGSMLIDAECVKDVMDQLRPEDFYLRANREIFETIYSMFVYSKPIDGVTVAGEMEKNGLYNDNTRSYLLQLMEITPTAANVKEYIRIVKDKALLRRIAETAGELTTLVQEGGETAQAVLDLAEQRGSSPCPKFWWTCSTSSRSCPCRAPRSPGWPPASGTWTGPSQGFTALN